MNLKSKVDFIIWLRRGKSPQRWVLLTVFRCEDWDDPTNTVSRYVRRPR